MPSRVTLAPSAPGRDPHRLGYGGEGGGEGARRVGGSGDRAPGDVTVRADQGGAKPDRLAALNTIFDLL